MPTSSTRRRTTAVFVAAALVGVSTAVLLSAAGTSTARAAVAPGSTVRASVVDETNAESEDGAVQQELAAGGDAVVFTSTSKLDDLDPGRDEGGAYENVYVRDFRSNRTVMISRGQFHIPEPPVIEYAGDKLLNLGGHAAAEEPVMGELPPDQDSYQPTISADGRFVAFVTAASNIVVEDQDYNQDIIVCDRDPDGDGEFDEDKENGDRDYRYFKVTSPTTTDSGYRIDDPRHPKLSDDATRIVWLDYGVFGDWYAHRVRTAVLRPTPANDPGPPSSTQWIDTASDNDLTDDHGFPDVSGDGRFIVFTADFWVPTSDPYDDEPRITRVVRADTETGAIPRVDFDEDLDPVGTDESIWLTSPVISRDGSVIAFAAEVYIPWPCDGTCWDRSGQPNVYVVRLPVGAEPTSELVSRDNFGEPVNGIAPGLSADGRFVSFVTDNLFTHDGVDDPAGESCLFYPDDGGDTSHGAPGAEDVPPLDEDRDIRTTCQVVVRDLVTDRERAAAGDERLPGTLASPGTGSQCDEELADGESCGGDGDTTPFETENSPSLSADGRRIAYESGATDLVPELDDANEAPDVYVRTFRPELRADPAPLDFGEVVLETATTATVRFDHVGIGPLTVNELVLEGDAFEVVDQTCVNEGVLLQQGGSCLVEIQFTPPAEGEATGVLRAVLPDEREFTVDLVGIGILEPEEEPEVPDPAAFAAGPDPLAFGERLIRSTGPDGTVTVTNTGETAMTVDSVTVEPPAARPHYTVAANTCATVAPGASCTVTVRFVPTASGALPGVLSFVDNAAGSPHLVGLTGSAPTPEITVSPAVSPPGRVVAVSGTGFTPGQQVLAKVPLAVQTGPATVAADGTFRAALLILPKAAIGNKTVVAAVNAFPEVNAEAPLLVVTPTVGPAEFVVRG